MCAVNTLTLCILLGFLLDMSPNVVNFINKQYAALCELRIRIIFHSHESQANSREIPLVLLLRLTSVERPRLAAATNQS